MDSAFANIVKRKGPVSPVVCFRPKVTDLERLAYLQQVLEAQGTYRPTFADAIRAALESTVNIMLAELVERHQQQPQTREERKAILSHIVSEISGQGDLEKLGFDLSKLPNVKQAT